VALRRGEMVMRRPGDKESGDFEILSKGKTDIWKIGTKNQSQAGFRDYRMIFAGNWRKRMGKVNSGKIIGNALAVAVAVRV